MSELSAVSPNSARHLWDTAIVVGASMAGLCAARVLADRFVSVVVIDRDELPRGPEPRRQVPQGRHPHLLLTAGPDFSRVGSRAFSMSFVPAAR